MEHSRGWGYKQPRCGKGARLGMVEGAMCRAVAVRVAGCVGVFCVICSSENAGRLRSWVAYMVGAAGRKYE